MDGRVVVGLLPAVLFENGHNFFVQHFPRHFQVQPFAVHANFIGGRFAKRFHLREALFWHVGTLLHDPV